MESHREPPQAGSRLNWMAILQSTLCHETEQSNPPLLDSSRRSATIAIHGTLGTRQRSNPAWLLFLAASLTLQLVMDGTLQEKEPPRLELPRSLGYKKGQLSSLILIRTQSCHPTTFGSFPGETKFAMANVYPLSHLKASKYTRSKYKPVRLTVIAFSDASIIYYGHDTPAH